jgi:hypothetical protein
MNINSISTRFAKLLDARFAARTPTTEDSLRYTFFAALLLEGFKPEEIELEHPHPTIDRAKVDFWISESKGRDGLAVEFKYDRRLPCGKNQNKSRRAGNVIHDLHRVSLAGHRIKKLSCYLTDSEMAEYFQNPANRLTNFSNCPVGGSFEFGPKELCILSSTVKTAAGLESPLTIKLLNRNSFPNGCELRIWEVLRKDDCAIRTILNEPPMSKYAPLNRWLAGLKDRRITMSFNDVEKTIGDSLPKSAHKRRVWWGNQTENARRPQARAWMMAGFEVEECDLIRKRVTFRRQC